MSKIKKHLTNLLYVISIKDYNNKCISEKLTISIVADLQYNN